MMSEQSSNRAATSTWSYVLTGVAAALTVFGYAGGVAILLFLGILVAVAAVVVSIMARREATITISVVTLLGGLAVFVGLLG